MGEIADAMEVEAQSAQAEIDIAVANIKRDCRRSAMCRVEQSELNEDGVLKCPCGFTFEV